MGIAILIAIGFAALAFWLEMLDEQAHRKKCAYLKNATIIPTQNAQSIRDSQEQDELNPE
jgi:hypothetical protein